MSGFFDDDFPMPESHQAGSSLTSPSAPAGGNKPLPREAASIALDAIEKELIPMPSMVGRIGTRAVELAASVLRRHLGESILDPAIMDGPLSVLDAATDDVHALGKDPDRDLARRVRELRVTLHEAIYPF